MKAKYLINKLNLIILLTFMLAACGGGSGGDSSNSTPARVPDSQSAEVTTILYGSVGDGPVVGATINVFDKNGALLATQSSDSIANYEMSVRTNGNAYPLLVEAVNGVDVVTGQKPDFTLRSIIQVPGKRKRANINPYSTMIVELAITMPGGLTAENIDAARQIVMSQLNFGLDSNLVPDPISSTIDETNVVAIIRSSETLGEMLRRSRDALGLSADQVITTLAADLNDGVLDGVGAAGANPYVAAVATTTSAQVLLEAMSGRLNVNNADATAAMNSAVLISMPGTVSDVNALPVEIDMLDQAHTAIVAAQVINSDPVLVTAADAVAGVSAGSTPAEVATQLPVEASAALADALATVVQATDAGLLEQVNLVVRNGGQLPAATNTAPTIAGDPLPSVMVGNTYTFEPVATDVDGDVLTLAVSNLPSWATFDATSGAITGVPGANDVGTFGNIVVSVSDGSANASLAPFSIDVTASPNSNTAPTLSGLPAQTVTVNTAYNFVPVAGDADGDSLSFGISNRPLWASFDPGTGALSGTPNSSDVGVTSAIVISVTDGIDTVSLAPFNISVAAIANAAPLISGTPAYSVAENSGYNFVPTASDADGDPLTFSVSNLPAWASFNSTTGGLTGTPVSADVAVYSGIVITVSDGLNSASLAPFSIEVTAGPNTAPTISGTPQTTVVENSAYSFVPTAADGDGDLLTFSVTNLPSWASFNTATGAITGMPGSGDVGTSSNIRISVSDGVASTALAAFSITVSAASVSTGTATLSWLPPTQNTDGSALTDLAGFKIYYGTASGNYTEVITVDNPGISSYLVDSLPTGFTYYFVMTAMDASGMESEYSTEGSKNIP
jgi:hypothetical protein